MSLGVAATSMPHFSCASSELAPRCGVRISDGCLRNGCSAAIGSTQKTSSAAPAIRFCSSARTNAGSHGTLDIFNTGECVSATGLAVSRDLDKWDWQGVVLKPDATGWDKYCRRINSVIPVGDDVRSLTSNAEGGTRSAESSQRLLSSSPTSGNTWLAFYDGSASEAENYEERCALAVSSNLRDWRSVSPDGPFVTSPFAYHTEETLSWRAVQLLYGLIIVIALLVVPAGCLIYDAARKKSAVVLTHA